MFKKKTRASVDIIKAEMNKLRGKGGGRSLHTSPGTCEQQTVGSLVGQACRGMSNVIGIVENELKKNIEPRVVFPEGYEITRK